MIVKSKKYGVADWAYVTPSSHAKAIITERALNNSTLVSGSKGNTQDFLTYLKRCRKNIVVSIQDFAGFSSNLPDFKQFLLNHPQITHLHVDLAPVKYDFEFISYTQEIIEDDTILAKIDYRKKSPRSL